MESGICAPEATILVVDDSESVLAISREMLKPLCAEVFSASTGAEAIRFLRNRCVSLVLLDHRLPDMTGKDVVRTLAEEGLRFPFVTITGHGDEKIAVEMMKLGALDYLAKDEAFAELLPVVVRQVLRFLAQEKEIAASNRKAFESEVKFRSLFDKMLEGFALHEIIYDKAGKPADYRFLEVNPAFEELTGLQRSQVVGKTVLEVLPGTEQYWIDIFGQVALTGNLARFEQYSKELGKIFEVVAFRPEVGQFASIIRDVTEQRGVEDALRASEERFRSIFESAEVSMVTFLPGGQFLDVNPALCRFLGYSEADLLRMNLDAITHPDDKESMRTLYRDLLAGKHRAFDYEKRYLRKDGSTVWGLVSVAGVYDPGGRLLHCVGLMQDITERKRYEELIANIERGISLKTGDNFFRSLVACMAESLKADCVLVSELEPEEADRIRTVAMVAEGREVTNRQFELTAPCRRILEEGLWVCPTGVRQFFPQDHLVVEMEVEGYAGALLADSSGRPLGILAVLYRRGIPDQRMAQSLLQLFAVRAAAELDRRHSEKALLKRELQYKTLFQEFQALLDGIPDVLLLLGHEMKVIWANRAALEKMAIAEFSAIEMSCHHFCSVRAEALFCNQCPVLASFSTGESTEEVIKRPDATLWGVKTFPLKDRHGEVNRVIMLASDITEKIRLREESARTGRLAAIGELAAGVAHEINNPTGLILMNLPVLREAFADAMPVLEEHYRDHGEFTFGGLKYSKMKNQLPILIDEALDGAQRIRNIVEDMKDFARGGHEGDFRLFDLNATVERAVRLVNSQIHKSTDRFSCALADDLFRVNGNPQRIEQVLVNLILNACQSLPDKSAGLFISTHYDPRSKICEVTVRDEGIGIPEEDMPYLTDPFFTTRRERGGTGLGLSVSARIVREHEGRLRFESKPGEGTAVTLELPAVMEGKTP